MAYIVGWAVLGAVLGWIGAWLLRGRMVHTRIAETRADARAKHEQLKRDLEARLGRLENELLGAKEITRIRDAAVAERDKLIRQQADQLVAGLSEIAAAKAERDDRQTKLTQQGATLATLEQDFRSARALSAEQEKRLADSAARLAQLEPVPAKLAAVEEELQATQGRLLAGQKRVTSQDQEISRLHKRTVELEPLTVQVKDRQARLVELEGRLAEAVRLRDSEIAKLKKSLLELEPLPKRLEDMEMKRAQLAGELTSLRRAKDEEIESLQEELKAIELLRQQLRNRDEQILAAREHEIAARRERDLAGAVLKTELAQRDVDLDARYSAIGRLHQQLAELAPLPEALANRSARALELERGVAQRDGKLRQVHHEAQMLRASMLEWMRVGGALPARNAEIARLRARLQAPD